MKIEISNISFRYDSSEWILKDLSLAVRDKSSVAILGNSGCGKTTLLNLIAGVLKPSSGTITLDTKSLSYLMQDVTLLPYKTALENTLLACELREKSIRKGIKDEAIKMLRNFQFEDEALRKFPDELSGGMKQKIGLVQILLTGSELLLLDEPFNAIDRNALELIESYLWDYVKGLGRTMILITHNVDQAILLSDRIIILGNDYNVSEVIPSDSFVSLPPFQRLGTEEFNRIFFEIACKMKS